MTYRTDIEGLRAIAVISVILFHLGYLQNGYLGVDIFFVISGYLITSIVYNEAEKGKFSILKFYERRLRRIIPLLLFVSTVALIIGAFVMLPDDLENLSQGVFASNFSVNNILMYITSADYWATKNDYKPLMHTWSLGIEEQFYILYPFLFFFMQGTMLKYLKQLLVFLTIASLAAFLYQSNVAAKFYFIQFRFFELSLGGLGAIYFKETRIEKYRYLLYIAIALVFFIVSVPLTIGNDFKIIATTFLTLCVLVIGKQYFDNDILYKNLLSNKVFLFLGKLSFSLYMWHQLVFAFSRYALVDEITVPWAIGLVLLTLGLSITTYFTIENPLRNRQLFSTKKVLTITAAVFILSTGLSFYTYRVGGIIKDFPELGLYKNQLPNQLNSFSSSSNIHIQYNENIRELDKNFEPSDKIKTLVIGNSFGRDIVNILLESHLRDSLQVRYFDIARSLRDESIKKRLLEAEKIFIVTQQFIGVNFIEEIEKKYSFTIDTNKIWIFGTKDFGNSNGIPYNNINSKTNFLTYRVNMKKGILANNQLLISEWGSKYIDLIAMVRDEQGKVLVFTPEGKFISQDAEHLTKFGASFFASLLKTKLSQIFQKDLIKADR